ncbi:hypothetical protein LguiB_028701 [Lonicera macranthoides]
MLVQWKESLWGLPTCPNMQKTCSLQSITSLELYRNWLDDDLQKTPFKGKTILQDSSNTSW